MLIPSKTNLFLQVGRRRPEDGRHLLATLFLPLDRLRDEVEVTPLPAHSGIQLRQTGRALPDTPPERNLAVRAAALFCKRFGLADDWLVSLHKSIPVAAGLGGGSADAAAVLRQLQRFAPQCTPEALRRLALSLGADIPFFLQDGPAFATGAGELLQPVRISAAFGVIIAFPGFPSAVQWAYLHSPERASLPTAPPEIPRSAEQIAALLQNDLAIPLKQKFPLLETVLRAMRNSGCISAEVSGSGSSCVGICPPHAAAEILPALAHHLRGFPRCELFHAAEFGTP